MPSHTAFLSRMKQILPENSLYTDPLRRLAWGTDAGFYRLTPRIVIRSRNEADVSAILREASAAGIPLTFRAAGTSLSGQAVSDSVLVCVAGVLRLDPAEHRALTVNKVCNIYVSVAVKIAGCSLLRLCYGSSSSSCCCCLRQQC